MLRLHLTAKKQTKSRSNWAFKVSIAHMDANKKHLFDSLYTQSPNWSACVRELFKGTHIKWNSTLTQEQKKSTNITVYCIKALSHACVRWLFSFWLSQYSAIAIFSESKQKWEIASLTNCAIVLLRRQRRAFNRNHIEKKQQQIVFWDLIKAQGK